MAVTHIQIPENLRVHPAFAPYRTLTETLIEQRMKGANSDDVLAPLNAQRAPDAPYRFVCAPAQALSALEFERSAIERGEIYVRPDSLHDWLNALVWMTFPRSKWAISTAHTALATVSQNSTGKTSRPRRRDILTLFDESGLILLSLSPDLPQLHAQHQWQAMFIEQRTCFINNVCPVYFGHGGLEQLALNPHRGLTVKTLWLPLASTTPLVEVDAWLAEQISHNTQLYAEQHLLPLPILGIPGWFAENEVSICYLDRRVFRPLPLKILPERTNA